MQWTLVIPLKALSRAKSRLSDTAADAVRPGLALAFAQDTVAAALACAAVGDVAVVTDDVLAGRELAALGAWIVPDEPGGGLNAALAHGTAAVRSRSPECAVAALNADLPASLVELARVLDAAAEFPRAFLSDAAAIGTTLLAASPGRELRPAFGTDSRVRHRASVPRNSSSPRWIPYAGRGHRRRSARRARPGGGPTHGHTGGETPDPGQPGT